jgi:hypothetical protein
VNELERLLIKLGRTTQEPAPPPVARRVAAELRRGRPARRPRFRTSGALALGLAVAVLAAVAAVPDARTGILRFFHLGGITVERVDELPPVSPRGPLAPGREVGLAEAQRHVSFTVVVPKHDRTPSSAFYYGADPPGGQVTLIYGSLRRPRLLVTEFLGANLTGAFDKKAGRRTPVEYVLVDGAPGIWLGGARHLFSFLDRGGMTRARETRLASHTLVWQRGGLTIRLEGDLSKTEAIRLAKSFEPAG